MSKSTKIPVVAYLQDYTMQEQAVRDFCDSEGYEVVAVLTEKASGTRDTTRTQLQAALTMIEEGRARGIVSMSLDGLSRDLEFTQKITDRLTSADAFFVNGDALLAQAADDIINGRIRE